MLGLTLIQPMAAAIVLDHPLRKDVENRPRSLPASMLGVETTIAIHAGKKFDGVYASFVREILGTVPLPHAGVAGAIVGVATLTGRVFTSFREASEVGRALWYVGPWGYEIKSARSIPRPIPAKGMLGFWRLTDAQEHDLVEQLELVTT